MRVITTPGGTIVAASTGENSFNELVCYFQFSLQETPRDSHSTSWCVSLKTKNPKGWAQYSTEPVPTCGAQIDILFMLFKRGHIHLQNHLQLLLNFLPRVHDAVWV